jgi:hypothetical protein
MSRERSRLRPPTAYLARVSILRYYVHGDEHETDHGTYFCRFRDLFLSPADFPIGARDHFRDYLDHLEAFRAAMHTGDFIPGTYRPNDAPNLFRPRKIGDE